MICLLNGENVFVWSTYDSVLETISNCTKEVQSTTIIKVQGMDRHKKNRVEEWESDVNRVEVICLSYFFIIIYDYLLLLFCCFWSKVHVEYHPRCELLRINRCSKHVWFIPYLWILFAKTRWKFQTEVCVLFVCLLAVLNKQECSVWTKNRIYYCTNNTIKYEILYRNKDPYHKLIVVNFWVLVNWLILVLNC